MMFLGKITATIRTISDEIGSGYLKYVYNGEFSYESWLYHSIFKINWIFILYFFVCDYILFELIIFEFLYIINIAICFIIMMFLDVKLIL